MKPLSEQDHYEILEIYPNVDLEGIERSYRMALATYANDSLAGYSVFGDGDAEALRERIEIAYRVLSDRGMRREYDQALGIEPTAREADLQTPVCAATAVAPNTLLAAEPSAPPLDGLDELDDGTGAFDGARLRRYRLRCGLELEDIAARTKVNPTYLRFIEDEQISDLPARVYVRGFVIAYATCLGIDANRVADSYMKRFDEDRENRRMRRSFENL